MNDSRIVPSTLDSDEGNRRYFRWDLAGRPAIEVYGELVLVAFEYRRKDHASADAAWLRACFDALRAEQRGRGKRGTR